ncbi:hypothetical protein FA95DRAFT_984843 [Auriscalpium vulgare]|uniref:Uncharacterized protein n=1 Tax=Auriscalpium vulgare TaxID=40419 RepID=A0ACB8R6Y7_9AGAM|nr:hypothetical protein FA95DRAFT_984843 [Auriscalpium vulgare]
MHPPARIPTLAQELAIRPHTHTYINRRPPNASPACTYASSSQPRRSCEVRIPIPIPPPILSARAALAGRGSAVIICLSSGSGRGRGRRAGICTDFHPCLQTPHSTSLARRPTEPRIYPTRAALGHCGTARARRLLQLQVSRRCCREPRVRRQPGTAHSLARNLLPPGRPTAPRIRRLALARGRRDRPPVPTTAARGSWTSSKPCPRGDRDRGASPACTPSSLCSISPSR